MKARGGACWLFLLTQIAAGLTACARPSPPPLAPTGPVTAESECRLLNGRLLPGMDLPVALQGEGRQVTVMLPGEAWCEVSVAGRGQLPMRQFVHMPPRVERRLADPGVSAFDMHFVMIEIALPPPAGDGPYPPVETVRAGYAAALRPGQDPTSGPGSGLTALMRMGARADVGAVDSATGCFPVTMEGDVPAPGNRLRHFEMRSRVCVAPTGAGAAATIQVLQEWAPHAPDAPVRRDHYRRLAERLFASIRLGAAP